MNVFSILSTGKSKLHEPSMSAMLAYLLNPNQDHGLGRKVINDFLELFIYKKIYNNFIDDKTIKFEIDLEVLYEYKGVKNYIDIQIKILDSSYKELHRIIIENKIKKGAVNPIQLNRYYEAVINDKNNDDFFNLEEEKLSVVLVTPEPNNWSYKLTDEFRNVDAKNKLWLYWHNEYTEKITIAKRIQNILKLKQEVKQKLKKNEIITIEGLSYALTLGDSGRIQLLNNDGDKIIARPLSRITLNQMYNE